jgi:hypothetical protein
VVLSQPPADSAAAPGTSGQPGTRYEWGDTQPPRRPRIVQIDLETIEPEALEELAALIRLQRQERSDRFHQLTQQPTLGVYRDR